MSRGSEDLSHHTHLGDAPRVHDGDAVADPGDDAEVVGDEDHGEVVPALELLEEGEVLRLDGQVEAGRGLVRDEEARRRRDGHGAHHALAHPARELMREGTEPLHGRRDTYGGEQRGRTLAEGLAPQAVVHGHWLAHLAADGKDGIERGHRVLEDHAHLAPAELLHLALVALKQRDVTIAKLSLEIAKADGQLGKDLLAYYASRFLNRSFLVNLAEFSNRLMRRYLDLAGQMAWSAERALAFEQDREFGIVGFDYFPRTMRGVTGADQLQLDLAELEAARIQGLTQTIPVKHTISLARDYPIQLGQLKKTGLCRFATSETPLRLVHPGVYGYRVRNVTVAAAYADASPSPRGMLTNQGVSIVTRDKQGAAHLLVRYPDALPLSEFRMRNDMWVFDLPDETLLPFEGSGIETVWKLMLSKVGNASSFEGLSDILITFDMRASYSALLENQHSAGLPNADNRSLLVSAKAMNPGMLRDFRDNGGILTLELDIARFARNTNEKSRKTLNFLLMAIGVDDPPFTATLACENPAQDQAIVFENGIALSNAGALADGNAGVPLPLNAFVGLDADQTFTLSIDADANPGAEFTNLTDVLLLVEYEAML